MDAQKFDLALSRIDDFFINQVNKNGRETRDHKENETIMDIALRSVQYGLAPSVLEAINYHGRGKYAHDCFDNVVKPFLARYIVDAYNSGSFNMDDIYQKMTEIRNYYHAPQYQIEDYTYGNAQKLVSIAFKMFFVLLHHYGIRPITIDDDFMNYNYCIIDSIILKSFKKNRFTNASLIETWSKCDDLNLFKETQRQLQSVIYDEYYNNFFYEVLSWEKEKKTNKNNAPKNTRRNNAARTTTRTSTHKQSKYEEKLSKYVEEITNVITDKHFDQNTFEACHDFVYELVGVTLPMEDLLAPLKYRVSPYIKKMISIHKEILKIQGIVSHYVLGHHHWDEYIPEGFVEDKLQPYFGDKVNGEYNYKLVVEGIKQYVKENIKKILNSNLNTK